MGTAGFHKQTSTTLIKVSALQTNPLARHGKDASQSPGQVAFETRQTLGGGGEAVPRAEAPQGGRGCTGSRRPISRGARYDTKD